MAFDSLQWLLDTSAENAIEAGYGPWIEQARAELATARELLEAARFLVAYPFTSIDKDPVLKRDVVRMKAAIAKCEPQKVG